MKVEISLKESGPAFWFLGEPKNVKVSLNFSSPGPVQVDFKALTDLEQKKLLGSLQRGEISCDTDFQELYEVYLRQLPQKEETQPQQQAKKPIGKTKEERLLEKCAALIKKPSKTVKEETKDSKNVKMFRLLKKLEEERPKPRVRLLDYLEKQVRKFQKEVALKIDKSLEEPPLRNVVPAETLQFDVLESEQETVQLDPNNEVIGFDKYLPGGGD